MAGRLLNFCSRDGLLVGPEYPIPSAAYDFVYDSGEASFGCNQLVDRDGRRVRQRIRGQVREYSTPGHREPIVGLRWVEEPRLADLGHVVPWSCGGHPRVSLPFMLDGENIASDTDWGRLIRGVLDHTRAVSRPGFASRHVLGWVQRLYHLIAHTPQCDALSQAVAELACDRTPQLRLAGWLFFCYLPRARGMAQLLSWIAELKPEALAHSDERICKQTLATLAQLAVAGSVEGGGTTLAVPVARQLLLEEGHGAYRLIEVLSAVDRDWVMRHAAQILKRNPTTMVLDPLIALHRTEWGELLPLWLCDLRRDTALDPGLFVAAVCNSLRGNERDAALAELRSS